MLELKGDQHLKKFALQTLLRGEEEVLGELHGQRGEALTVAARAHVGEHGAEDAAIIHAVMLEEVPVFDGRNGRDEVFGQLVVGHEAALGVVLIGEAGDQQRLQLIGGQLLAVVSVDLADGAVGKVDGRAVLRVVRLRTGVDRDRVVSGGKGAHGRGISLPVDGVAGLLQFLLDIGGLDLLARTHLGRRGIDAGRLSKERMLQARVDHMADLGPVIGEHHAAQDGGHRTAQACGNEDILPGDPDGVPRHFDFDYQLGFTPSPTTISDESSSRFDFPAGRSPHGTGPTIRVLPRARAAPFSSP